MSSRPTGGLGSNSSCTTDRHPCGRWHYTRWQNGEAELIDLEADAWELTNVVLDRPTIAAQLDAELDVAWYGGSPRPATCGEGPGGG